MNQFTYFSLFNLELVKNISKENIFNVHVRFNLGYLGINLYLSRIKNFKYLNNTSYRLL